MGGVRAGPEDLDQVVIWVIRVMANGLTTMGDLGTMLVLLRKRLKLLKLGILTLGIQ